MKALIDFLNLTRDENCQISQNANYYEILGISKTASEEITRLRTTATSSSNLAEKEKAAREASEKEEQLKKEIKKTYWKLSIKAHPDKHRNGYKNIVVVDSFPKEKEKDSIYIKKISEQDSHVHVCSWNGKDFETQSELNTRFKDLAKNLKTDKTPTTFTDPDLIFTAASSLNCSPSKAAFQDLQNINEVLADVEKREEYDEALRNSKVKASAPQVPTFFQSGLNSDIYYLQLYLQHYEFNDVNKPDGSGKSLFFHLCELGITSSAYVMMGSGKVDYSIRDNSGRTLLHAVADHGSSRELAQLLLEKMPKHLLNVPNNKGNTPLHLACAHADKDVIDDASMGFLFGDDIVTRLLAKLPQGFNYLEQTNYATKTPVQLACEQNSPHAIKAIFKYVSKNKLNLDILPLLETAIRANKPEIFRELMSKAPSDIAIKPLLEIALGINNGKKIVNELLAHKDEAGYSFFLRACRDGKIDDVYLFLGIQDEQGNEWNILNAEDNLGNNALHLACFNDHENIVRLLLSDKRFNSLRNSKNRDKEEPFNLGSTDFDWDEIAKEYPINKNKYVSSSGKSSSTSSSTNPSPSTTTSSSSSVNPSPSTTTSTSSSTNSSPSITTSSSLSATPNPNPGTTTTTNPNSNANSSSTKYLDPKDINHVINLYIRTNYPSSSQNLLGYIQDINTNIEEMKSAINSAIKPESQGVISIFIVQEVANYVVAKHNIEEIKKNGATPKERYDQCRQQLESFRENSILNIGAMKKEIVESAAKQHPYVKAACHFVGGILAVLAGVVAGVAFGATAGGTVGGVVTAPIGGVGAIPGAIFGGAIGGIGGGIAALAAECGDTTGKLYIEKLFTWGKNPKNLTLNSLTGSPKAPTYQGTVGGFLFQTWALYRSDEGKKARPVINKLETEFSNLENNLEKSAPAPASRLQKLQSFLGR